MLANTCYAAFCPAASIADFVYDFAGDVYLLIRQGASLYAYVCLCMLMYAYVSSCCGRHAGNLSGGLSRPIDISAAHTVIRIQKRSPFGLRFCIFPPDQPKRAVIRRICSSNAAICSDCRAITLSRSALTACNLATSSCST